MKEVDFYERRDDEWVCVEQCILDRREMQERAREWIEGEKPESASALANGRRCVRSWEF